MSRRGRIAAIPTMYRRVQMRSRLEAKWAVFFDILGWEDLWEYEPLDLCPADGGKGRIPDFVMRFAHPTIIECKPAFTIQELAEYRRALVTDAAAWLCVDQEKRLRELDEAPDIEDLPVPTTLDQVFDSINTPPAPPTRSHALWAIDNLVDMIEHVHSGGDPQWVGARRALVVGSQLFQHQVVPGCDTEGCTIDGTYALAHCPGCKRVGLVDFQPAHGWIHCVVCGSADFRALTPIPSSDIFDMWRTAGTKSQWKKPTK